MTNDLPPELQPQPGRYNITLTLGEAFPAEAIIELDCHVVDEEMQIVAVDGRHNVPPAVDVKVTPSTEIGFGPEWHR